MARYLPLLTLAALLPFGARAEMMTTHRIPAALASEAVAEAVAVCAKQGYFETAVVVDADGAAGAVDKAYTAAPFKADTRALFAGRRPPRFCNLFTHCLI